MRGGPEVWSCQVPGSLEPDLRAAGTIYGCRADLMARQIREPFGAVPGNLEESACPSQCAHVEAVKLAVEPVRASR